VHSRVLASAVFSLLAAAGIAACGSGGPASNGVASKSPAAIVTAASTAVDGLKSVRIAGSLVSGTTPITLNLDLVAGKGASGSMSENGLSFQIIAIGNAVYISGSQAFWTHTGGAAMAALFKGKWLQTTASGNFSSLSTLTNVHDLFPKLLGSSTAVVKGATSTVRGQKVVAITDAAKSSTLYVATTGPPYPIEVVGAGKQVGTIVFEDFNKPVALTAPAHAINVSGLKG
jgi:hypothetical protein